MFGSGHRVRRNGNNCTFGMLANLCNKNFIVIGFSFQNNIRNKWLFFQFSMNIFQVHTIIVICFSSSLVHMEVMSNTDDSNQNCIWERCLFVRCALPSFFSTHIRHVSLLTYDFVAILLFFIARTQAKCIEYSRFIYK